MHIHSVALLNGFTETMTPLVHPTHRCCHSDNTSATSARQLWWRCHSCAKSNDRRLQQANLWQAPVVPPDLQDEDTDNEVAERHAMLVHLLSLPPGGCLQLAVLRCGVRYTQRVLGYLHSLSAADRQRPPLLQGPLVAWDEAANSGATMHDLFEKFQLLINYQCQRYELVKRYLTMAEIDWGLPVDDNNYDSNNTAQVRRSVHAALCSIVLFQHQHIKHVISLPH